MNAVFVTGTDTGVGKTAITGLLARSLSEQGYNVITQKWVETGTKGFSRDVSMHLRLMGKKKKDIKAYLPYVCPYTFPFASSPHLASRLEKRVISVRKIKESFNHLRKEFDIVIVEGVGGALVPYNNKRLVIDIAKELGLPVIIVVGNKLGAINHTLLTIEALQRRGMKIIGIVINNLHRENKIILDDNVKIIKQLTGIRVIETIQYGAREGNSGFRSIKKFLA